MKKIILVLLIFSLILISCGLNIETVKNQNTANSGSSIMELRNKALYYVKYDYSMEEKLFHLMDYYKYVHNDMEILKYLVLVNYNMQNIFDAKYYLDEMTKINPNNPFVIEFKNAKGNELEIEKIFYNYESKYFKAYFKNQDALNDIQNILNYLDDKFISISNDFRLFNYNNKILVLFYNPNDFLQLNKPYWASGYFDGKIRVNINLLNKGITKNILVHELTHSIITLAGGYNIPIWFHEGAAQYYEYNKNMNFLVTDELLQNFIEIKKIENSFNSLDEKNANIAYIESLFLFKFIIERYGANVINDLLREFKSRDSFDNIYQKILLRNTDTLEYEFKNYLQSCYSAQPKPKI